MHVGNQLIVNIVKPGIFCGKYISCSPQAPIPPGASRVKKLNMLKNYFITAWRNLSRNKIYSFINVAGLSLGIACVMLIVLYTKDELSFDRFHANAENIYQVGAQMNNPDGSARYKGTSSSVLHGPRFAAGIPEVKTFVRLQRTFKDFKLSNDIVSRELLLVDTNFFSVFSFPLKAGDPNTALNNPKSLVISEKTAKEYFGNGNAIGNIIQVRNGEQFEPFIVTGVAAETPQNSSIRFDILLPLGISEKMLTAKETWMNFHLNTFLVLNENADVAAVERKMNAVFNREAAEIIKEIADRIGDKATTEHVLLSLPKMHLNTEFQAQDALKNASDPIYSYILSAIAIFILVIACINFINLTIARSARRAKEIGIRKVVGGARNQLILQFLGESCFLCICAFAIALLIVWIALPSFNEMSNKALALSYLMDAKLIAVFSGLFVITALLAGFYPALILSGFNPVKTLYSRFYLPGKNYLQKSLVVLQFSLATLLVLATCILYKQFNFLTNKDLGYDDSHVVIVEKPNLKDSEIKLFTEQLLTNPNITSVALKNRGREGTMARAGEKTEIGFDFDKIDANYLPLYKIPVVQGRNFSPQFPNDSTESVLVNEAFVELAGWKEPVGQYVDFFYDKIKYKVIGVVKNYHFRSLNEKIGPQVFNMLPRKKYGLVLIKIKPGSETASLQHIGTTYKKLFPLNPYTYKFKDLENLRAYESEARWKQMMLFAAALTIFISCIGLFGLSVLAAEKRTKEIGIRKVLGASVLSVVTALSKEFLWLVVIAMLIAIPAAWYFANQWLENYPYRITLDWQLFVLAGLLVVLIALGTVSFQSIKAAIVNPVKSLRTE